MRPAITFLNIQLSNSRPDRHHDREQDTPSSDDKGYPYQVRAASRPDRRSGHRYKKCLNLAALEMNSDHNRNFKVEAL